MNIYPAIDLKSGKCVRLTQGDYQAVTQYPIDPIILAKSFAEEGATILHVVDLDGAKQGASINFDMIKKINQESGLRVQTGGGIRTKQQVKEILESGICRVVLGSIAISQPETVKEWLAEFGGERIVLALDVRLDAENIPRPALHGWQTQSEKSLWDLLDDYQESELQHVLCTDIQCDGMLQGPNINLYQQCVARYPNLKFQASGGVSSLADLKKLSIINLAGAVVGKALYENKFSLQDALLEVQTC